MGKMLVAIAMIILIEISVSFFLTCVPGDATCVSTQETSLYAFLLAPQNWSSDSLATVLENNVFLVAGGLLVVAGLYFTKSEYLVYAVVAGVLFGFGKNLATLWNHLSGIQFFGDAAPAIATLIVALPMVYFIMATLDWARGRD